MTQLLRYEEAAVRLGLRPATVRKLAAQGLLPKVRPIPGGRAVRIPADAVQALIDRGGVAHQPAA